MEISLLPRWRQRFQRNEEVEILIPGDRKWNESRGGIAREVWHNIRDTIAASPSLPLFFSFFRPLLYFKDTEMFVRPSLLQFKRDETSSDCKLSDYSVAGLNVYDCSLLIACLVNSRTKWCRDERNFNLRILFLLSPPQWNISRRRFIILIFPNNFPKFYILYARYLKIFSLRTVVWLYAGSYHW